jgi:DNA-binding transcriptional regulator YdaS (Cro superfamily)
MKAPLSSASMDLQNIIRRLGGPAAVGRVLGVRSQAVSLWVAKNRVPIDRVPALVALGRALGVDLKPEDLRPDVQWAALRCEVCA